MQAYRALKLQQSPNLRQALKDAMSDSKVLIGVGVGIPAVATTKILAATSADWCWIDAEHTPMSPTLMAELASRIPSPFVDCVLTRLGWACRYKP